MVKGVQLKSNLTKKIWINKDADGMGYGMETGLVVIAQFPCKLKFSHRNIWRFRQSEYIYYTNQLQKFHRRYAFTHWKKKSFQKHKTADQVIKHTSQSAIQLTDISTWKHQSEFHYVHRIPHIQKRNACLFFFTFTWQISRLKANACRWKYFARVQTFCVWFKASFYAVRDMWKTAFTVADDRIAKIWFLPWSSSSKHVTCLWVQHLIPSQISRLLIWFIFALDSCQRFGRNQERDQWKWAVLMWY